MNKTIKFLALALSLLTIGSSMACGKGNGNDATSTSSSSSSIVSSSVSAPAEEPENIQLTLNKTQLTLVEDEVAFLVATSNVNKSVKWSSDNEQVATVSVAGKVIAKTAGTATITAYIGNTTTSCSVTVLAAEEKTKDYIDADSTVYLSLLDENEPQLMPRYMAVSEDGESVDGTKTFTFTSLNTDVVTVSETGVVTALSSGQADIEIRCGDVVTYVVADVYTDVIASTDDWLEMLANRDVFARFYLACDLDFTGVTYNIEPHIARGNGFNGELNGGFHTVSNVTVTGNTSTEGQSLFGGATCINVHDVAFVNVTFTARGSSGLCSSLIQHKNIASNPGWVIAGDQLLVDGKVIEGAIPRKEANPADDKVIIPAKVNNVIIDASFVGHSNVAFCRSFYGGLISNLYINMRRGDDQPFMDTDYLFVQRLHIWYMPKAASNTIVRIDKGVLSAEMEADGSYPLDLVNITYTTNELLANYNAYQMFDRSVWSITPKGLPTFVK